MRPWQSLPLPWSHLGPTRSLRNHWLPCPTAHCPHADRHPSTTPHWPRPQPEPIPTQADALRCVLQPMFPLSPTPSPPGAGGADKGALSHHTILLSRSPTPLRVPWVSLALLGFCGGAHTLRVTAMTGSFPAPRAQGAVQGETCLPWPFRPLLRRPRCWQHPGSHSTPLWF